MNSTSEILENYNGCKCNGGGGGDFSTAQVTFVNSYDGYFPEIVEDEDGSAIMFMAATHSGTVTIPLYGGNFMMDVTFTPALANATYSGNAELVAGNTMLYITGDCTITVFGTTPGE